MSNAHLTQQHSPEKKKGELLFDVLLVIGIAVYLAVARGYPPIGRQVPMVVGVVALVVAVVQLIGYFVPGLWTFTHGSTSKDELLRPAGAGGQATSVAPEALAAEETEEKLPAHEAQKTARETVPGASPHQTRDTSVAVAWAGGFLTSILVIGYVFAVPVFFLAYFGARRSWRLAIVSAVVMGLITRFLFEGLLGIPLPTGLLPGG